MRIRSIDVWEVVVPFRPNAACSPEYHEPRWDLDRIPKLIVRVRADGLTGIGETNRGVALQEALQEAKRLVGAPLNELPRPTGPAAHAYEIALLDLLGRQTERPVWRLLGDQARNRVKNHYWTAHRTPADLADKCREARDHGFDGIKIKTQFGEPDIERLRAMRDAVGPDFAMTIDPNSRYHNLANTLRLARQVEKEGHNVLTLEDMFRKQDLDSYRFLRSKTNIPVTLHLNRPDLVFHAAKAEAMDFLNTGSASPSEFLACAAVAEAAGIPYWHGSEIDLGIKDMAGVHCCAVAEGCTLPSDLVGFVREDDLVEPGIRFENGCAVVPDAPGLGVELDMTALERYKISHTEVTP